MTQDDEIHVRLGRTRNGGARRARPFIARVLAACEKQGGLKWRTGRSGRGTAFGRGRAASFGATRRLSGRSRSAVIKARVVRHWGKRGPLRAHFNYLRRDGVTKDRAPGRLFDAQGDNADHRAFAERCDGDRHHFRFIISPDSADRLSDLRAFTRDLMRQARQDLGTDVDWVAIDHWNTQYPHVHVVVRGKANDGEDLVISPDYISEGLRARAAYLITQ
jgi:type IV secretory pathway VirD2 relaxase